MTGKIRTFVQVVKTIPVMLKSLWWSHRNQDNLQDFGESFGNCDECDLSQGVPDGMCDEHRQEMDSLMKNGPF